MRFMVPVPKGKLAKTPKEAEEIASTLGKVLLCILELY